MANLNRVVYLSEAQKNTLFTTGTVTSGQTTITYDANDLYITPPEYDSVPTANSSHLISSGAVYNAINGLGTGSVSSITPGNGLINGTSGTSQTAITSSGTISHADTSSVSNMTTGGRTYINSIKFDDFGHVTEIGTGTETVTDTRDSGYGKITPAGDTGTSAVTANTTQIAAGTYNEAFTFKTGNKWLTIAGTNSSTNGSDVLTIGHALSGVTAGTAGTSSNTSGITLAVPYVTYDTAGHITAAGTHTHTIPAMTASENGVGRITAGTGISVSYSSGNVTVTNNAVDTLTGSPAASKTITAFDQTNGGVKATFGDIAIAGSQVTSGTVAFARLPDIYWANEKATSAAAYNKEPEVKSLTIGNGTTASGTKKVQLVYDSTAEVLNFVFT